jgi:uncharacterized protein (TIGR00255 family)
MIKGMTGFGSAQLTNGNVKGMIEIKSVNHRYLDIAFHLPIGFAAIEEKIRLLIKRFISRGRITVSLKITQKQTHQIELNPENVKKYIFFARQLKKRFKLSEELRVSDLITLPGVIDLKETAQNVNVLWPVIARGVTDSLKELEAMRRREGVSLAKDLTEQLKRMTLRIKNIKSRAKMIIQDKKKTITSEEFLSFQKGNDINEELSRLLHYVDEFKGLLLTDVPIGKRLAFVAQEMQRESNTIGSKLQDKHVSNAVISIKTKIEKIREQAQNVE